jgi:hypothetical protein
MYHQCTSARDQLHRRDRVRNDIRSFHSMCDFVFQCPYLHRPLWWLDNHLRQRLPRTC